MANQAAVNDHGEPGTNGVVSGISGFSNDLATLFELQAKLAALDFKESAEQATRPLALVAGGLAVVTAALPVLLIGVATLIAHFWNMSREWALLLVAVVALVLGGALVAVAGSKLARSFQSFRRTREELNRNLAWLRTVLVHSGRAVPRHNAR